MQDDFIFEKDPISWDWAEDSDDRGWDGRIHHWLMDSSLTNPGAGDDVAINPLAAIHGSQKMLDTTGANELNWDMGSALLL